MSMTIQEAIRCLHLPGDHLRNYDEYGIYIDDELKDAMQMAMAALREKAEREDPKPLTLEELRQMDGEPVWINGKHYGVFADVVRIIKKENGDSLVRFNLCRHIQEARYGKTWIAYRHKPKEVQK